jgi:hypothetical protein
MMIGPLMPWLYIATPATERTITGFEAEGSVLLVAGALCTGAGVAALRDNLTSWLRAVAAVVALGILADTLYVADDPRRASLQWPTQDPDIALGPGLWVVLVGSLVTFAAATVRPAIELYRAAWGLSVGIHAGWATRVGDRLWSARAGRITQGWLHIVGWVAALSSLIGVFIGGAGVLMILAGHFGPATMGLATLGVVSFIYSTWFFRYGPGRDRVQPE